jgi:hypothetical protein
MASTLTAEQSCVIPDHETAVGWTWTTDAASIFAVAPLCRGGARPSLASPSAELMR